MKNVKPRESKILKTTHQTSIFGSVNGNQIFCCGGLFDKVWGLQVRSFEHFSMAKHINCVFGLGNNHVLLNIASFYAKKIVETF